MGGTCANTTSGLTRRVVLHADDLGLSPAVNDGIFRGFREGLLTSTSVLANAPSAADALNRWKPLLQDHAAARLPSAETRRGLGDPDRPFDLGIHLNLTQGRPLTAGSYPRELLDRDGRFCGIFTLLGRLQHGNGKLRKPVEAELARQIEFLVDHGFRPTHLNGHQYVEMIPAVADMIPALISRFHIPVVRVAVERALFRSTVLRALRLRAWLLACVKQSYARRFHARLQRWAVPHPDLFFGTAHAGRIDLRAMRLFLARGASCGMVEIGMHPATSHPPLVTGCPAADGWADPLAELRPSELEVLLSAELPEQLHSYSLRLGRLSELAQPDVPGPAG